MDAFDQIAADLERLDQEHTAELHALAERQAGERAALIARLREGRACRGATEARPDYPDPDPSEQKRHYRPAENERWVHVVSAAFDLGVSRTTAWRWAEEQMAQWPHGDAQQVDINRLRHLRPPRGKNGKNGK